MNTLAKRRQVSLEDVVKEAVLMVETFRYILKEALDDKTAIEIAGIPPDVVERLREITKMGVPPDLDVIEELRKIREEKEALSLNITA
jgi:hypothetical protein